MSLEDQLIATSFLLLTDHAICCLVDRLEQMCTIGAKFNFLYNQENLLREYEHNSLPSARQNLYKTRGDIDPLEINNELERFVVIVTKNNKFSDLHISKTTIESLSKLVYSSSSFADMSSRLGGRCLSFRKLKLIKIFHKSTMMDERYYVISMISIERACLQDLVPYHIVNVFAIEKARRKTF